MSGYKETPVSVPRQEYNRLQAQARESTKLRHQNAALTALNNQNAARQQRDQREMDRLRQIVDTQSRSLRAENVIHEEFRRACQELQNSVQRQAMAMNAQAEEFQTELRNARAETSALVEQSNRNIRQAMNAAVGSLTNQIGAVSDRLNRAEASLGSIIHSDQGLLDLAEDYQQVTENLIHQIAENYPVDALLPNRLSRVQRLAGVATRDIADCRKFPTNAATARSNARAAAEAAMQLHEDVVLEYQRWLTQRSITERTLATAEAQLEASRSFKHPDSDFTVDVDYWTNGGIMALTNRLSALQNQINGERMLTIADLDGLQQAGIQLISETEDTATEALISVNASQNRADIARNLAEQTMAALGLAVQDYGYQGEDERGAFRMHLLNPYTRFEMIITEYPQYDSNNVLGNRIESEILNYGTNNENEGNRLAYEALSSLTELGFCSDGVHTVPGYENRPSEHTEHRDLENWRRERVKIPAPVTRTRKAPNAQGSHGTV